MVGAREHGRCACTGAHPDRVAAVAAARLPARRFKPFTIDGAHGGLFDAEVDTLELTDVIGFEMESLMRCDAAVAPALSYLFDRLDERYDGRPTLLVLDEAWVFLDHPFFAECLREWLKTLRKKNVPVVFATLSLSDIQSSKITPVIVDICPPQIFLPNARARETRIRASMERSGPTIVSSRSSRQRRQSGITIISPLSAVASFRLVPPRTSEINKLGARVKTRFLLQ